jgi:hypothetical protein
MTDSGRTAESKQDARPFLHGQRGQPTKAVSQMSTITLTPSTRSTQPIQSNLIPPHCWCGQDLEYLHGGNCPRRGTTRAAALTPPARAS